MLIPRYFLFSGGRKGGCVTVTPLSKKTTDHSGRDHFEFGFYCDRCEKSWRSPLFPFANAGFTKIDSNEVRDMLWAQEHRLAFESANLEAQFHFNYCPACGRWVCDDCFCPLGSNERGLCRDCEAKLASSNCE